MEKLNAVFQGGGVKGIGLVGALARVEGEGVQFAGLAGTSAGSIVAALYAAGYSSTDLKRILLETSFDDLLDPYVMVPVSLWRKYGIHRGNKLYEWIYKLLREKKIVHFQDLQNHDLKIIASDVQHRRILVFDKEHYPELEIAEAVRMSIGIPLFFEAYRFGQSLVVDGGLLSNYPLWVFAHAKEATIGFKLVSKGASAPPKSPRSFPYFLLSLISTMLDAHDKEDEKTIEWVRTIHIPTHDISTTDFGIGQKEKELLYGSGFLAADEYIKNHNGRLTHPIAYQVAEAFASLDRIKRLSDERKDVIFKPIQVKRRVVVERPNAELNVLEELMNASDHPQNEVTRYVVTDAPTDQKDLAVRAWFTIEGSEHEAAVAIAPSKDFRQFTIRIGFKGRVIGSGKQVQIRWECRFPGSVALNDDYWVFPMCFYTKLPETVTLEVQFSKLPADILFFSVSEGRLRPMNLMGPISNSNEGKIIHAYSLSTDAPVELFLLRWRLE